MNANDSSSLVDSPLAGRLGENRALLYRGDLGTLEKFRPFSPPPAEWLGQLSAPATRTPQPLIKPAIEFESAGPARDSRDAPVASAESTPADVREDLPSIDELNVQ